MGEKGQIISVEKNTATIRLQRTEACAKCKACLAGMKTEEMIMTAQNRCGAIPGDWVNIELENKYFFKAVIIMYGFPFVFLFSGFLIGNYAALRFTDKNPEIIGFLTGIAFMVFAFFIIKLNEHKFETKDYLPIATETIKNL